MELTKENYRIAKLEEVKRIGVVTCEYGCLVIKVRMQDYSDKFELQVNRKERFEDVGHVRTYKGEYDTLEQAQCGAVQELVNISRSYATIKK